MLALPLVLGSQASVAWASQHGQTQEIAADTFRRLSGALQNPDAAEASAALTKLVAWTEAYAKSVLEAPGGASQALELLFEACTTLAFHPAQSDRCEEWFALAGRAVTAMPAGDARRYHNSELQVSHGQMCLDRGELAAARMFLERALEDDPDPSVELYALFSLAEAERQAGASTQALQTLERTGRLLGDGPANADGVAQIELIRAQTELDLGLPDLAFETLMRAQEAAKSDAMLQTARRFEVDLLLAVDRSELVVDRLEAQAKDPRSPLSPALRLRLAIAQADLECIDPGWAPDARGLLEELLEDASLTHDERRLAHVALVDFHLRKGNYDDARRHLEGARAELDRQRPRRPLESNLRERAEIEAYASFLMRRAPFKPEKGRRQLAALHAAFDAFIAQLRGNELRPGGVGYLHFVGRRFILNEMIAMSIAVEGEQRGFGLGLQALIEAQELGSLSRSLSHLLSPSNELVHPPTSADSVMSLLTRPDGGVLVFLPDYHRTLVMAFGAGGPPLCEIAPPRSEWLRMVKDWSRRVCKAPNWSVDRPGPAERAQELAELTTEGEHIAGLVLPKKIRERLESWKSVTIVGDDLMEGLPFEALPMRSR